MHHERQLVCVGGDFGERRRRWRDVAVGERGEVDTEVDAGNITGVTFGEDREATDTAVGHRDREEHRRVGVPLHRYHELRQIDDKPILSVDLSDVPRDD